MLRRLEKRIYVPLPGRTGLEKLYTIFLKNVLVSPDINWEEIYKKSDHYTGADIEIIVREATYLPMRRKLMAQTLKNNNN